MIRPMIYFIMGISFRNRYINQLHFVVCRHHEALTKRPFCCIRLEGCYWMYSSNMEDKPLLEQDRRFIHRDDISQYPLAGVLVLDHSKKKWIKPIENLIINQSVNSQTTNCQISPWLLRLKHLLVTWKSCCRKEWKGVAQGRSRWVTSCNSQACCLQTKT